MSTAWGRLLPIGATVAGAGLCLTMLLFFFLPMPLPVGGGSCGPGTSSLPAVVVVLGSNTLAAGPKPKGTALIGESPAAEWLGFAESCNAVADNRVENGSIAGTPGVALVGAGAFSLDRRRRRNRAQTL